MTAARTTTDPVLAKLREELTDLDRQLVATVNKRLKLVQKLWRYKEAKGIPVVDPGREEWLLLYLGRCNSGPLSPEGLKELYTHILELTKEELGGA